VPRIVFGNGAKYANEDNKIKTRKFDVGASFLLGCLCAFGALNLQSFTSPAAFLMLNEDNFS
jgi:hypothetical protein